VGFVRCNGINLAPDYFGTMRASMMTGDLRWLGMLFYFVDKTTHVGYVPPVLPSSPSEESATEEESTEDDLTDEEDQLDEELEKEFEDTDVDSEEDDDVKSDIPVTESLVDESYHRCRLNWPEYAAELRQYWVDQKAKLLGDLEKYFDTTPRPEEYPKLVFPDDKETLFDYVFGPTIPFLTDPDTTVHWRASRRYQFCLLLNTYCSNYFSGANPNKIKRLSVQETSSVATMVNHCITKAQDQKLLKKTDKTFCAELYSEQAWTKKVGGFFKNFLKDHKTLKSICVWDLGRLNNKEEED